MVKYEYAKTLLIDAGIPEEKIVVIPHWIPIAEYDDTQGKGETNHSRLAGAADGFFFLFVGRLDEEKGCRLLLNAFDRVSCENEEAHLVLVGDGPLRSSLEETVRHLGLQKKVHFLGRRAHSEIPTLLSQADSVVLPDLYFNYQWTLVEAAASGRPIVATDVVATREILEDGRNALLTSVDEESLADGMSRILQDPSLAVRLGNAARKTARERHSMRNLRLYENLVEEVCSSCESYGSPT